MKGIFHFFPVKKPESKGQRWTSYWDFLAEKAKISTKKQSRKIAMKKRKRQLFGTNLDKNLVKTATFWDKVRTMNFRSTYPTLSLQYKLMHKIISAPT